MEVLENRYFLKQLIFYFLVLTKNQQKLEMAKKITE